MRWCWQCHAWDIIPTAQVTGMLVYFCMLFFFVCCLFFYWYNLHTVSLHMLSVQFMGFYTHTHTHTHTHIHTPYTCMVYTSSSHVWMWELDHKESWVPKNWQFWIVVWEKTLESPLDCKKIKPVNPKGNQSWIVIGRTDAEAEAPILWPPFAKNWLTGNDPDAGNDWRREEKGMTEDEMVGWRLWLNGHEFEQAPGVGDGQGGLACYSRRVRHDWVTELNWYSCDGSISTITLTLTQW